MITAAGAKQIRDAARKRDSDERRTAAARRAEALEQAKRDAVAAIVVDDYDEAIREAANIGLSEIDFDIGTRGVDDHNEVLEHVAKYLAGIYHKDRGFSVAIAYRETIDAAGDDITQIYVKVNWA